MPMTPKELLLSVIAVVLSFLVSLLDLDISNAILSDHQKTLGGFRILVGLFLVRVEALWGSFMQGSFSLLHTLLHRLQV